MARGGRPKRTWQDTLEDLEMMGIDWSDKTRRLLPAIVPTWDVSSVNQCSASNGRNQVAYVGYIYYFPQVGRGVLPMGRFGTGLGSVCFAERCGWTTIAVFLTPTHSQDCLGEGQLYTVRIRLTFSNGQLPKKRQPLSNFFTIQTLISGEGGVLSRGGANVGHPTRHGERGNAVAWCWRPSLCPLHTFHYRSPTVSVPSRRLSISSQETIKLRRPSRGQTISANSEPAAHPRHNSIEWSLGTFKEWLPSRSKPHVSPQLHQILTYVQNAFTAILCRKSPIENFLSIAGRWETEKISRKRRSRKRV